MSRNKGIWNSSKNTSRSYREERISLCCFTISSLFDSSEKQIENLGNSEVFVMRNVFYDSYESLVIFTRQTPQSKQRERGPACSTNSCCCLTVESRSYTDNSSVLVLLSVVRLQYSAAAGQQGSARCSGLIAN